MNLHYYINGYEVHPNTFKHYLAKEWKRAKISDPTLDAKLYSNLYDYYGRITLGEIKFERKIYS